MVAWLQCGVGFYRELWLVTEGCKIVVGFFIFIVLGFVCGDV